jgi:hypothetical protein
MSFMFHHSKLITHHFTSNQSHSCKCAWRGAAPESIACYTDVSPTGLKAAVHDRTEGCKTPVHRAASSAGRAPRSQRGGREFEPRAVHQHNPRKTEQRWPEIAERRFRPAFERTLHLLLREYCCGSPDRRQQSLISYRFFLLKVCLYMATPRQRVSATAAAMTRLSSKVFIASAFCHAEAAAPTV